MNDSQWLSVHVKKAKKKNLMNLIFFGFHHHYYSGYLMTLWCEIQLNWIFIIIIIILLWTVVVLLYSRFWWTLISVDIKQTLRRFFLLFPEFFTPLFLHYRTSINKCQVADGIDEKTRKTLVFGKLDHFKKRTRYELNWIVIKD